jgi:uncharacterized protein YndB with AHSA1/START domain
MKTTIVAEPGKQEITVSREFDASLDLLFRAHISPELFVRWYGCRGMTTTVRSFDARSGGSYEYGQRMPGSPDFTVRGVFHDVTEPVRIVRTVELLANPGRVSLETLHFEVLHANRSRVTVHTVFQSVADRDRVVESGVAKGASETFERLEDLLGELKCRL